MRLALLLGAFVLAVAIAEVVCGFTGPGRQFVSSVVPFGKMPMPNQRAMLPSGEEPGAWVPVTINRFGMRGPEVPSEKAPKEIRVLCVGDSFVFGGGLGDGDTFPAIAQRIVEEAPVPIRFMNGGGNGHDPRSAKGFLEAHAKSLRPDVLVVGWNWNDLVSILSRVEIIPPLPEWIRRFSLYRFTAFHRNRMNPWNPPDAVRVQQYLDDVLAAATGPNSDEKWNEARRALSTIRHVAREGGIHAAVLVMPELTWRDSPAFPGLPKLIEILERQDWAWVDCQPEFYAGIQRGEQLVQSIDPFHPSARGQRLMADVALRKLRELGWLP